jgi:tartronate-semialdehyde synthase
MEAKAVETQSANYEKIEVAEALVRILEENNVEVVFGIPGAAVLPIYKHLAKSSIKHITTRHEEGAIHAADGHARSSGKIGVCLTTSGPAATNLITGLYTAYADSIPLIAITGEVESWKLETDAFQEVKIVEIAKSVTKASFLVLSPERAPQIFQRAFIIAKSGRPGPVLIDIPLDVQKAITHYHQISSFELKGRRPSGEKEIIKMAVEMISSSRRPIVLVGHGVILSTATQQIVKLAEKLKAPIVTTNMAKGAIPPNHPLYIGNVGTQCHSLRGNHVFKHADLVIAVGCRFSDRHTGEVSVYTKGKKFLQVDVDPKEIGKNFSIDLGVVSDAKEFLDEILRVLPERKRIWHSEILDEIEEPNSYPKKLFEIISETLPKDTIFTLGCGLNQIWAGQFLKVHGERSYILSGGAGTLGFEIPAAVGAKAANPEKTVVSIVGDGGILFMGMEIATSVKYNLPIIILLLNNRHLGLIRQSQIYLYGYEYEVNLELDGRSVDFKNFARAFGAEHIKVEDLKELKEVLRKVWKLEKTVIIEVQISPDEFASMGTNIENIKEFSTEN